MRLDGRYFTKGFYPSGKPTAADAIAKPSGALLKAMLINSAVPVSHLVLSDCPGLDVNEARSEGMDGCQPDGASSLSGAMRLGTCVASRSLPKEASL